MIIWSVPVNRLHHHYAYAILNYLVVNSTIISHVTTALVLKRIKPGFIKILVKRSGDDDFIFWLWYWYQRGGGNECISGGVHCVFAIVEYVIWKCGKKIQDNIQEKKVERNSGWCILLIYLFAFRHLVHIFIPITNYISEYTMPT